MKHILTILLCLFAAVSYGEDFVKGDLQYTITTRTGGPKTVEVSKINNYNSNLSLTIPSTVTDYHNTTYSVTSIADNAFEGRSNIKEVTMSDEIYQIGRYAFKDCTNLVKITISGNVKEIREGTFWGCTDLQSISGCKYLQTIEDFACYNCGRLQTDFIYSTVKEIGEGAFMNCRSLSKLDMEKTGIKTISKQCFKGCSELSRVILPENLSIIEDEAFAGCTYLTYYYGQHEDLILKNITKIGDKAFQDCSQMSDVYFFSDNPQSINISTDNAFPTGMTLHVPIEYTDDYMQLNWVKQYFGNNVKRFCTNIESISFTNTKEYITADINGEATLQLTPQVLPDYITNDILVWEIHSSLGKVTVDENGVVTFKEPGMTGIVCGSYGLNTTARCDVICWANGIVKVGNNYYHISGDEAAVANCFRNRYAMWS